MDAVLSSETFDTKGFFVPLPAGARDLSFLRSVQIGSAAHQSLYSVGTRGSVPESKTAGT
jgi:hypothetical protein